MKFKLLLQALACAAAFYPAGTSAQAMRDYTQGTDGTGTGPLSSCSDELAALRVKGWATDTFIYGQQCIQDIDWRKPTRGPAIMKSLQLEAKRTRDHGYVINDKNNNWIDPPTLDELIKKYRNTEIDAWKASPRLKASLKQCELAVSKDEAFGLGRNSTCDGSTSRDRVAYKTINTDTGGSKDMYINCAAGGSKSGWVRTQSHFLAVGENTTPDSFNNTTPAFMCYTLGNLLGEAFGGDLEFNLKFNLEEFKTKISNLTKDQFTNCSDSFSDSDCLKLSRNTEAFITGAIKSRIADNRRNDKGDNNDEGDNNVETECSYVEIRDREFPGSYSYDLTPAGCVHSD